MKEVFSIENLCCANCANLIEEKINKIEGVETASVNFIMQKITIDFNEDKTEKTMKDIVKAIKKIEPKCKINM